MPLETTPLRGHDSGEGWHLRPRRRYLFAAILVGSGVALFFIGRSALAEGAWPVAVVAFLLAPLLVLTPFERRRSRPARMHESPTDYGLLLPVHPIKVSLALIFGVVGLGLIALPVGFVYAVSAGRIHGSEYVGAAIASLLALVLAVVFVAAAWTGVEGRRAPSRGVLLSVDAVVLRTQYRPVSIPWHGVRAFRPHWKRLRPGRDLFRSIEDPINNWLTVEADPSLVDGVTAVRAFAGVDGPTFDAANIALDPALFLAVCRFYLADAEARAELRTPAALDRVASIARSCCLDV